MVNGACKIWMTIVAGAAPIQECSSGVYIVPC